MTKKVKHWRRRCRSYSNRTLDWLSKSETPSKMSGSLTLSSQKHSKSWLSTREGSSKTMQKTKPSEERCRDSSKRIRVWVKKSETLKRIWDCLPTRYLSWTTNLMSTGLGTIKSPRLTNRRSKSCFHRTTRWANKLGQHKRIYDYLQILSQNLIINLK